MSELRVELRGDQAVLGTVSAGDVARLILAVENAMAQTAAVVLGRPKMTTGRFEGVIENSVRFRLRAVEEGSVVPVLQLPDPVVVDDAPGLDLETVKTLGETALERFLDAVEAPNPDPLIAKAVLELADAVKVGDRYEAVRFRRSLNGTRRPPVCVDGRTRARLRSHIDAAAVTSIRPDDLTGVLVEADFEKRTARLRTPTQARVDVDFSDEHADDIHAALRHQATLRGQVVYDPKTHTAKSVALSQVVQGRQLELGVDPGEFWVERTFADLAQRQGTTAGIDPAMLYDDGATDEERDAFMAAIAELGS